MMNKAGCLLFFSFFILTDGRDPFSFESEKIVVQDTLETSSRKKMQKHVKNGWTVKADKEKVIILQDKDGNIREVTKAPDCSEKINPPT